MSEEMDPAKACVALNLRRLSRVVTRRYEEALRPVGLTSFQFSALVALHDYPSIPQTALAEAFGMSLSTLNRNLKPLTQRDAIAIAPSPRDRRIRLVSITAKGRRLYKDALPLWELAQAAALEKLGDGQWDDLKTRLRPLLD